VRPRTSHPLALTIILSLISTPVALAQTNGDGGAAISVGPARGTLLVVGGGRLDSVIVGRFIQLAGGPDAPIVVIPTASGDSLPRAGAGDVEMFTKAGARDVAVLHTTDRRIADSKAFADRLRSARAVWFSGGRQWRLADAYLGTRTQKELFALLERGGVIGGSSAGASIQASYMVRGAPEGNTIMMAPGHERGLGFLRGVAVDQHIITRHREGDLEQVVRAHPELLGIGIDEDTAIEVHGDTATVLGRSRVAITDGRDHGGKPYYFLSAGDRLVLSSRRELPAAQR